MMEGLKYAKEDYGFDKVKENDVRMRRWEETSNYNNEKI